MGRIKVLLADDHPVIREGLRAMLSTDPELDVVAEAGDGQEAERLAAEHTPDVILMDVRMPNIDGMEATRRIKAEFPAISVIMLMVYDNDAYIVESARAGASGYLLKDASCALLVHTLRAVASGAILFKTSLLQDALTGLLRREAKGRGILTRGLEFEELSPREGEVLKLLVEGHTNKGIAAALTISEDTAKKHVQNLIGKLGATDRTQAAVKAVRAGLVQ